MRTKRLLASVLIGAQLAIATPAFAADPPPQTVTLPTPPPPTPGEVDVGAAISPMKKGQKAPFTGILLSPKATAILTSELDHLQQQIDIEVQHAQAVDQAQCTFKLNEQKTTSDADKKIQQAQIDEQKKRIDVLNQSLQKSESARGNTTFWVSLGTGAGVVVGVAASLFGVWIAHH